MVRVEWTGGMAFVAQPPSGNSVTFDAIPEFGGQDEGPTPVEAFLGALAACTAMDVIGVLRKKRQQVTAYRVEIDGDRTEPGVYPRPFTTLRLRHVLEGVDLDPAAVERAIRLSEEKYCTVAATLRQSPPVETTWEIVSPSAGTSP